MARYVKFPGTAGSYASTDDVNLLDADTAHLQQSVGNWAPGGTSSFVQSTALTPVFGDFHTETSPVTNAGTGGFNAYSSHTAAPLDLAVPISDNTLYSYSSYMASSDALRITEVLQRLRYYDAAGALISTPQFTTIPLTTAFQHISFSDTSPALAAYVIIQYQVTFDNVVQGVDFLYIDAATVRAGSVATFVPSLRIVGTLFEAFNATPTNPPIAFAADGTPLTVGVSWAGDLFSYSRHDGADATAPIVAIFDADDVPSI